MKKREILLLIAIVAIDLLSKYYIQSIMTLGDSIPFINNFFYLTLAYNSGAAWGILSGKLELFFVITIVVIVIIVYMLFTTNRKNNLLRYSLIVILGGTLGNFYDRVIFGYVRDFFDFYLFGYDFPIFNIADASLCIGYFLLALYLIKHPEETND